MSESTPRTITGLTPRRTGGGVHPDASRLIARNRTATPPSGPPSPPTPSPVPTAHRPQAAKTQINAAVHSDLRARIRAAYRATAHAEGHRSFSDFVSSVLEAEAERLEAKYNGGERFTGGEAPLAPGRPLGD